MKMLQKVQNILDDLSKQNVWDLAWPICFWLKINPNNFSWKKLDSILKFMEIANKSIKNEDDMKKMEFAIQKLRQIRENEISEREQDLLETDALLEQL